MSSEHTTFAPSLVINSMGAIHNDSDATSPERQLTLDEQHEYGALKEAYKYDFGYRRQTRDLIKWVDTRLANQSKLVGEKDMPKYNKLRQETEKMTAEARKCFGPDYEYGSLAKERIGKLGEENPFSIWSRNSLCGEIERHCQDALKSLNAFKAVATEGWDNPFAEENDESKIYWDHLVAQRKEWAAADAPAVSVAEGSCESETEGGQDRGSSQSTNSNKDPSQNPSVGSFVKYKPAPARPARPARLGEEPKALSFVSWCDAQTAIAMNKRYILECQRQSEATTEANKRNFDMTAGCLTDYNKELERLYPSKEPDDEDESLKTLREETAEKYSRWVRTAKVLCPSIEDQCTTKIGEEDDCSSDSGE